MSKVWKSRGIKSRSGKTWKSRGKKYLPSLDNHNVVRGAFLKNGAKAGPILPACFLLLIFDLRFARQVCHKSAWRGIKGNCDVRPFKNHIIIFSVYIDLKLTFYKDIFKELFAVLHIPLAETIKELDNFILKEMDLYDHTKVFL